jgi:hypothetical protein
MLNIEPMLNLEPMLGQRAADDRARLLAQIRQSPGAPAVLADVRKQAPDLAAIPQTTYTLYRQFEHTGYRRGYEHANSAKRAMLTRAVLEFILGDASRRDIIHDLLWSICEETSWVYPAHEEQGPDFWELRPSPRRQPWGAHTALTREPDAIDLFCAITGSSLAEAVYLIGDELAPEVVQRVRQEVERRIFKPYLAYGRQHWWYKGPLNWNGVCNGSIGLAFMRLEHDPRTLNEAIAQALEGFEAYIATGFEADGGSIEGIGYWNFGLEFYVTLAELLREQTGGQLDLLAAPRLRDIARYPLAVALAPGTFVNFGDAVEQTSLSRGVVQRIAERTGVIELRGLLLDPAQHERTVRASMLPITLRDAAWWDGMVDAFPAAVQGDHYLPDCGLVKLSARTAAGTANGRPVLVATKAGHTDGHHSHTDIGTLIYNLDGESLLCDPGRGLYSKDYFRQARYQNIFCNSIGHSVPRIGGQLQAPGPEFHGHRQYRGQILDVQMGAPAKSVRIELKGAYALPALTGAERRLELETASGVLTIADSFRFAGAPLEVEEAFVTWGAVDARGARARITGQRGAVELTILEPAGAVFARQSLADECRLHQREGELTRLAVVLPPGGTTFRMKVEPK